MLLLRSISWFITRHEGLLGRNYSQLCDIMDLRANRNREDTGEKEFLRKELPETLFTEPEEAIRKFTLGQRLTCSFPNATHNRGLLSRPIFEAIIKEALAEEQQKAAETPVSSCLECASLDHTRRWLRGWKVARYVLVMYSLVTSMFFLAFSSPSPQMRVVDLTVWVFFVVDLVLCCFVTYHDEDNHLVKSLGAIMRRYAGRWLIPDLIAVLPLQLFGQPHAEYYLRLIRLLKVPHALNIITHSCLKVARFLKGERSDKPNLALDLTAKYTSSILYILILVVFYTYAMACFWYWYVVQVQDWPQRSKDTFDDYLPNDQKWESLQRNWYFLLTTLVTVGYGDYSSKSIYERGMLILVLFTGVSTYSYIIGKFNSLVAEIDSAEDDRFGQFTLWIEQLEALNSRLPSELRSKLLSVFFYYHSADRLKSMALRWWEAESLDDLTTPKDPYLAQLPAETLRELQLYLFSDVFSRFKGFFGGENLQFDLSFHMQPRQFCPEEFILREGEEVQEILFVMKGQVAVGPVVNEDFVSVLSMKQRGIVGDFAVLAQTPSFTNFRAEAGDVSGFAVPAKPFLTILHGKYPHMKDKLMVFSSRRATFAKTAIEKTLREGRFCPFPMTSDTEMQEKEQSLMEAPAPRLSIDLERRASAVVLPTQKLDWEDVDMTVKTVRAVNKRFDKTFAGRRKAGLKRWAHILRRDARAGN